MRGDHPPDVGGRQPEQLGVGERLDARGAHAAVEHRQLAEDVAGPERRERDRAAVGVLARNAKVALADDVAGVGVIALVEDPHALRERAGDRHGADPRELVGESSAKRGTRAISSAGSGAIASEYRVVRGRVGGR